MAHYAKVNSQGIVEQVIVAEQDVIDSGLFGNPTGWVQTSYNTQGGEHKLGGTPLRKNYAGIGYTYDIIRDAFIPPKPADNATLNEDTCLWEVPEAQVEAVVEAPAEVVIPAETSDTVTITDVVLDLGAGTSGAVDTVTFSSAEPTISLDLGTASATPTI